MLHIEVFYGKGVKNGENHTGRHRQNGRRIRRHGFIRAQRIQPGERKNETADPKDHRGIRLPSGSDRPVAGTKKDPVKPEPAIRQFFGGPDNEFSLTVLFSIHNQTAP